MIFYADDVKRITGVERLRLHNWMKAGFITPSGQVAKGHGTKNEYTIEDIYKITLLKKLIENGMHGSSAALFVNTCTETTWKLQNALKKKELPGLILCMGYQFVKGNDAHVETWIDVSSEVRDKWNRETGIEIRRLFTELNYDQVIVLNIGKLVDDVNSRI